MASCGPCPGKGLCPLLVPMVKKKMKTFKKKRINFYLFTFFLKSCLNTDCVLHMEGNIRNEISYIIFSLCNEQ